MVNTGLAIATVADFATVEGDAFRFVPSSSVANFSTAGATDELRDALSARKGLALLDRLQWVTQANVLQQSVTYGDYTAALAEKVLYDANRQALSIAIDGVGDELKRARSAAIAAMRINPTLARNVVLLAMRHTLNDRLGGQAEAERVRYRQTYYQLALQDFAEPSVCAGAQLPRAKLKELFPNWTFEYRVSASQRSTMRGCPEEVGADVSGQAITPDLGSGVAVPLGDFYVVAPNPLALSEGLFELVDILRLSLAYRDKVRQAIVDREVGQIVRDVSGSGPEGEGIAARTALALLNEGWGWAHRKQSEAEPGTLLRGLLRNIFRQR